MTPDRAASFPPWPRCGACDGPARPEGPPAFRIKFAVETRSEANDRNRWAEIARKKDQRERTIEEISVGLAAQAIPERGPWFVRITRIAPGKALDRSDNLPRALKAVQDAVAAAVTGETRVGKADDCPALEFAYKQRTEDAFLGVEVEIWGS